MTTTIDYLIDFKEKEVYVFENFLKRREKEEELAKLYGNVSWTLPNGVVIQGSAKNIQIGSEKLKHYYGTVFILYKFNDEGDSVNLHIEGRMKEINTIKRTCKVAFHKFKKIILIPYDKFMGKDEPKEVDSETQKTIEMIKKSDVTRIFNKEREWV